MYPVKRVFRSWNLFLALLIGVVLASTFVASIDVRANITARESLERQLSNVLVDMEVNARLNFTNFVQAREDILAVDGVEDVEVLARSYLTMFSSSDNYTDQLYSPVIFLPDSSCVYDGWENRPLSGIGENETYVLANTTLADQLAVNDTLMLALDFPTPKGYNKTTIYLNLTVAGFAQLDNDAYSIATGQTFYVPRIFVGDARQDFFWKSDHLIVDWGTLEKLWSTVANYTIDTRFLVSVDREGVLNPWDTAMSANNVQTIADNIRNKILANYEHVGGVQNNLGNILSSFSLGFSDTIIINLIIVTLPVFFIAWYVGSTVSDVAFNLRRREIGLLSTKGLSSGQIQRMFLAEALVIGVVGGLLGVVGGLILNQVFTGFNLETLFCKGAC